ncbi:MAG TPA: cyclic nucleotide-binding domain-containing protein [Crinalium sp.]|jgi:CRP-like cAMP-binding protein
MKKALYLLAEISDRDFEWLLSVGRSKAVPAGTVLIHEDEPINALYIVLSGTLAVSVEALSGAELARLGTGEIVGEMSFVDARRPSATVKAVEDSVVWSIPRSQLAAKLSQDISFSSHFFQSLAVLLSDRLRSTINRLGSPEEPQFSQDDITQDAMNPHLSGNLSLAEARLDWMLKRL